MATSEEFTIKFLNEADVETVDWISEVFEDISERLKSAKYIDCLEGLSKKYPHKLLRPAINAAKNLL